MNIIYNIFLLILFAKFQVIFSSNIRRELNDKKENLFKTNINIVNSRKTKKNIFNLKRNIDEQAKKETKINKKNENNKSNENSSLKNNDSSSLKSKLKKFFRQDTDLNLYILLGCIIGIILLLIIIAILLVKLLKKQKRKKMKLYEEKNISINNVDFSAEKNYNKVPST